MARTMGSCSGSSNNSFPAEASSAHWTASPKERAEASSDRYFFSNWDSFRWDRRKEAKKLRSYSPKKASVSSSGKWLLMCRLVGSRSTTQQQWLAAFFRSALAKVTHSDTCALLVKWVTQKMRCFSRPLSAAISMGSSEGRQKTSPLPTTSSTHRPGERPPMVLASQSSSVRLGCT